MDRYRIQGTPKTPSVEFNSEDATLEFSGVSIPEDTVEFYQPIILWIKQFLTTTNPSLKIVFKLSYINTSSLQFVYEILSILDKQEDSEGIIIDWYYLSEDDDMRELGEDFQSSIGLKISLIEVKAV